MLLCVRACVCLCVYVCAYAVSVCVHVHVYLFVYACVLCQSTLSLNFLEYNGEGVCVMQLLSTTKLANQDLIE